MTYPLLSIPQCAAIESGKGGVGKTSITANIGGEAAADGVRTLIVDLDAQGDLADDFGYPKSNGEELFNALVSNAKPPILRDVRPNLDVVPGGEMLGDIPAMAMAWSQRDASDFGDRLLAIMHEVADDYQLILIDTPPGDRVISEGALIASTSLIIPTQADDSSIGAVTTVAKRFVRARARNPRLQLAGVVMFDVESRSMRLERHIRSRLSAEFGGDAPVFERRVRHAKAAAVDARHRGLLVREIPDANKVDRRQRLAALKAGEKPEEGLFSRDVAGLADDYKTLTREVLQRVVAIRNETAAA